MGVHDFDFLPGRWTVENRRLVEGEWITFPATSHAFAMLDGVGNHDHFHADGYEGFSLRLYDAEADVWRIWWSSTARPGRLDPPVEGRFAADGTATSRPTTSSTTCRCGCASCGPRSPPTRPAGSSPSFDEGETWVPDWTMLLTRAE